MAASSKQVADVEMKLSEEDEIKTELQVRSVIKTETTKDGKID